MQNALGECVPGAEGGCVNWWRRIALPFGEEGLAHGAAGGHRRIERGSITVMVVQGRCEVEARGLEDGGARLAQLL